MEISADFVCAVCTKYFCVECVAERYYPRPGYICHSCSGEKPREPTVQSSPESAGADVNLRAPIKRRSIQWTAPSTEWLVIALCIALSVGSVVYWSGSSRRVPELVSNQPADIATYCLSVLDHMEYRSASPSLQDIEAACLDPIRVEAIEGIFIVTAPDSDIYGFTEIEIELNPMILTVME